MKMSPNLFFFPLDYKLIAKGYNLGTARWKRGTGQAQGRDTELPTLSSPLSLCLHVFISLELS